MSVLAHYGGIDEIGVFVVPAVAVILFLRWAERRARERSEDLDDVPDDTSAGIDRPTPEA